MLSYPLKGHRIYQRRSSSVLKNMLLGKRNLIVMQCMWLLIYICLLIRFTYGPYLSCGDMHSLICCGKNSWLLFYINCCSFSAYSKIYYTFSIWWYDCLTSFLNCDLWSITHTKQDTDRQTKRLKIYLLVDS